MISTSLSMPDEFPYICLDSVDSTNNYLKAHREYWTMPFFTVHTLRQSAGRGRHGRVWHSNGNNLTFSFIFNLENSVQISAITIFAGLALRKSLSQITGCDILLKWPNDIYYQGKKLGGILAELVQLDSLSVLVFGIGINLHSESIPEELHSASISLMQITGKEPDHKLLIQSIMREMASYLPKYSIPLPDEIQSEFSRHCDYTQNRVSIIKNGSIEKKLFNIRGIANNGNLIVEDELGIRILSDIFELN